MKTIKTITVAATMIAGMALFAGPASAAKTTQAQAGSAASSYRIPCQGGKLNMSKPYRSGRYIKATSTVSCSRYTGFATRGGYYNVYLEQYRGLGIWRNKAHNRTSIPSRAFTKTVTATWKCSGGNQLYKNFTQGVIVAGNTIPKTFKHELQRRITC
ncbi:hypothetical protein [Rhizohabitans arisaemae]|uniref:hypothetical protein n=1 Tax=Rhizohabitans arisaemae TaxID=2720610 RepID=UPI0024B24489|nr:hypothetical protein [Rhizohabitans arisaemae]